MGFDNPFAINVAVRDGGNSPPSGKARTVKWAELMNAVLNLIWHGDARHLVSGDFKAAGFGNRSALLLRVAE